MHTISLKRYIPTFFGMLALLFVLSLNLLQAKQSEEQLIPAFLPTATDVPKTNKLPIDGEWMIEDIQKRVRIDGGRAYAIDSWLHLFVLEVKPQMVVSKNWRRIAPGQYSGQDLPLIGPFTAKVLPNGNMSLRIQGVFGLVNLTLSPINIDDQRQFDNEKSGNDSVSSEAPAVVYGFDGTGQNKLHGDKTNVLHFLNAHRPSDSTIQNIYAAGVGTLKTNKYGLLNIPGLVTGAGGRELIELMYDELVKNFEKGHKGIVIVGFSRGAALSREFANVINERGDPIMYKSLKRPYGKPPTIMFMGLFDTVYSFGSPFGKTDLGYRKHIPSNVRFVAHATAGLEKRITFDLWSIHSSEDDEGTQTGSIVGGDYRIEKEFKGGHDDVGGAEKNNFNGYKPLQWILEQGQKAGVALAIPSRSDYETFPGEEVDPIGKGKGERQVYFPKMPTGIPAIYYKDAKKGCEGKQVYLSGTKCYQCPDNYKRFSLTRKMTHPEACTERGIGLSKDKVPATYVWGANGCPRYQFKYKGICMKCPAGTKREHIAGIDNGQCKLE